jgi:hypothetical protein
MMRRAWPASSVQPWFECSELDQVRGTLIDLTGTDKSADEAGYQPLETDGTLARPAA